MLTILKIAGLVAEQLGSLLADEFFWIIILVLIMLYRRNSDIETRMLGSSYPLAYKVSGSVLVGLAGGLAGSLLVILMGISIEDYTGAESSLTEAIAYIWVIAILLSMINPRYLCFSYAGGIVALMNLLFGFPSVNVSGLMALIGVLHLIESFLIWMDGHTYSVPLFLKRKDGRIVGGYNMNRIWPIPLVVFAVLSGGNTEGASLAGIISMPGWWPVLKHTFTGGSGLVYLPIVAPVVLGYGDMAMTMTPEKKCRTSALRLGCYSLALILLSVAASELKLFAFIAAVFAPVAHELLILYGGKEEEEGEPFFEHKNNGVKILYARKASIASKLKLEPGDTIIGINGNRVCNESQLAELLNTYPSYIWLDVKKASGKIVTVDHTDYRSGIGSLGALIVPGEPQLYYEMGRRSSIIKTLLGRFNRNNGKKDLDT